MTTHQGLPPSSPQPRRELSTSVARPRAHRLRTDLTGYLDETVLDGRARAQHLTRALIGNATQPRTIMQPLPFTESDRARYLAQLNERLSGTAGRHDPAAAGAALDRLEAQARAYKSANAAEALREVVRLLVAASGHDLPEIRTRANEALERVLAPKPYDAPLATRFVTARVGEPCELSFELPPDGEFALCCFPVRGGGALPLQRDEQREIEPLVYDAARDRWLATPCFHEIGSIDFAVVERREHEWIFADHEGGRVNVLPDLRGEIVLEIFTDIHGHTGLYWHDRSGHPGLVYNEHGEVIRIGTFDDVAAHLADLKQRWSLTAIYLLGMQQRGSNHQDWAPAATSPSPFAPMSLCEPDARLGGASAFRRLVDAAHALDMKIIVDVIPHLNRQSTELPDELAVRCLDEHGQLVVRASTDGRHGTWNDGKLLNYRKLAVWSWLADSIRKLILEFDIDGIRFDSAHAVPIMMKKAADLPYRPAQPDEALVEGEVVTNERGDDHFATTGFYDCSAKERLAVPLHTFLMRRIAQAVSEKNKRFFVCLAECFWGHERQLARSGVIPYNAALFKVCEAITHGRENVRALYHLYDEYLPNALPQGAVLLGILGNHDERRAVDTFGPRGLRAAVGLTLFLSEIVLDYEGNAEGESWKVFLDNIHLDWNQAAAAANRSAAGFYREWYLLHRRYPERGHMVWANNSHVAAALRRAGNELLLGAFNFSDATQHASLQFDNPQLPIDDDAFYRVEDPVYSHITDGYDYFTGSELRASRIETSVPFTERVKLLKLSELTPSKLNRSSVFRASFLRMAELSDTRAFDRSYAFQELSRSCASPARLLELLQDEVAHPLWQRHAARAQLALKRALYHLHARGVLDERAIGRLLALADRHQGHALRQLARACRFHHRRGTLVFVSAEVEPFSKSGGLASVAYELPREMAEQGEDVVVITPRYAGGDETARRRMQEAIERYGVAYTGFNVRFWLGGRHYEVGVHVGQFGRARVFMLDHHELFDGLYWGLTSEEKLRRRIGLARASAEVICTFGLQPVATFTNDAYAGLLGPIVRHDPRYRDHESFRRNSFVHVIHNGGWQYADAFARHEHGRDLFALFDLPAEAAPALTDPAHADRLHCMAAGVRAADQVFTVSPSYAAQIAQACDGLEPLLGGVVGISNGIGRDFRARVDQRFATGGFVHREWPRLRELLDRNRELQEKLTARYPELLLGPGGWNAVSDERRRDIVVRMARKLMLQNSRGLQVDPDKVLLVMIHRITDQKGFQLLLESSPQLFCELGYQVLVGGAVAPGDARGEELARGLHLLQRHYPNDVSVRFGFEDVAVPFLAADLVAMPSQSEPGGLVQLEAFACGALVLARATGGLRDTVRPIGAPRAGAPGRVTGNGFLFEDYSPRAFAEAAAQAAQFLREATDQQLHAARRNAERSVFHWDHAAREYVRRVYAEKELLRLPSTSETRDSSLSTTVTTSVA